MRLLGALIAGGQSRRFGSDKALALVDGRPLISHIIDALRPQVEDVVMCGRAWPGLLSLPDQPEPDQGPLGGLCAALHFARENGYDAVLTASCDTLPVPQHLAYILGYRPAVIEDQPLFGFWPATLSAQLAAWPTSQPRRDLRGWIVTSGALDVETDIAFSNLNTPEDYARFTGDKGLTA